MSETRVSKYQEYRDSFTKKDQSFITPKKETSLSINQGLFLKIEKRKKIENILIISPIIAILIAIVVCGIIVF